MSSSIEIFFHWVVFHWGCLPLKSSTIEVVFHRGCLPLRLSSIKVVYHWACLPLRSSSIEGIFNWGCLSLMSASIDVVWFGMILFQVSKLNNDIEIYNISIIFQDFYFYRCCEMHFTIYWLHHTIPVLYDAVFASDTCAAWSILSRYCNNTYQQAESIPGFLWGEGIF